MLRPAVCSAARIWTWHPQSTTIYFKVFLHGNIRDGTAAATVLVVIVWLWIFALITVVGAQISAIAMGLQPMPCDLSRTIELVYEDHASWCTKTTT